MSASSRPPPGRRRWIRPARWEFGGSALPAGRAAPGQATGRRQGLGGADAGSRRVLLMDEIADQGPGPGRTWSEVLDHWSRRLQGAVRRGRPCPGSEEAGQVAGRCPPPRCSRGGPEAEAEDAGGERQRRRFRSGFRSAMVHGFAARRSAPAPAGCRRRR